MNSGGEMIDVSVGLDATLPVWPGSTGVTLSQVRAMARGDVDNASHLACDVHAGTHVDAPSHFVSGAATVDEIELETLVGPAWIADCRRAESLSADVLRAAAIPSGTRRLLLRTTNSGLWRNGPRFIPDYAALTADAASWIVEQGIRLVGIDYLSIQRFADPPDVHVRLLAAGVVVVEGLDLSAARPGGWELLCLPLKLIGAEAAPARVVLRRGDGA